MFGWIIGPESALLRRAVQPTEYYQPPPCFYAEVGSGRLKSLTHRSPICRSLQAGSCSPSKHEASFEVSAPQRTKRFRKHLDAFVSFVIFCSKYRSTLSGLGHAEPLRALRGAGYRIEIIFLRLPSAEVALARVATRVRHGGHDVPETDIRRRFRRGWEDFNLRQGACRHLGSV